MPAVASGWILHDCVGHKEPLPVGAGAFVVDVIRGTTGKFDPAEVTKEYAALLKEYKISTVTGDNYAAQWVAGAWQACNVSYVRSELPKSQIYLETIPLFARHLVRLPDHPKLLRELRLLERHTHRSGKDSIDHPSGGHDDYANAVCGVLRGLSNHLGFDSTYRGWNDDDAVSATRTSNDYAIEQMRVQHPQRRSAGRTRTHRRALAMTAADLALLITPWSARSCSRF